MAAKNNFSRVSPNAHFKRDGLPDGWCAVRYSHFGDKKFRRNNHGRWFSLKTRHGEIYRVLKFPSGLPADQIVLDWQGWLDLNGRADNIPDQLEISIKPVSLYTIICKFYIISSSHPDPGYRLAADIAFYMGSISILLSLLPAASQYAPLLIKALW